MYIKLLISDFDGVFTDNSVYIDESGKELVKCCRADGIGIKNLLSENVSFIVCSSEIVPIAVFRGEKIGFKVFTGVKDKGIFIDNYLLENNYKYEECAYIGNDINDIPAFEKVKYRFAVNDSYPCIKNYSTKVLTKKGGEGAVREACDFVVRFNKEFDLN